MPVVERHDASVLERWDTDARIYTQYLFGELVEQRPFTAAENAWADTSLLEVQRRATAASLVDQSRVAYSNNKDYLALVANGTATNADHIAQVPRLTRQMQAAIRLVIDTDLLDDSP